MAKAKPNVPWSVKGIDPDARTVAKDAAKKAGMTLGEWITHTIHLQADGKAADLAPAALKSLPANVVTVEQLREVVDSLNRMNQRLRTTEDNTKAVAQSVNLGMGSVLDRLKKVETTGPDGNVFAERIEKLEKGGSDATRADSLKALEQALRGIVTQYETTHTQTIERMSASEDAVHHLAGRIDHIDHQTTASFEAVRNEIDRVNAQIQHAEDSARQVMGEVRDASGTDDIQFIERTGKKLRILGAEIKRSGDQIQVLENHIRKLSGQIDASEKRSSEGILKVSASIDNLRREVALTSDDDVASAQRQHQATLSDAANHAEDRLSDLQGNFDQMMSRLDTVSDNQASRVAAAKAEAADAETAEANFSDAEANEPASAQAVPTKSVATEDADFDAIFGDDDDDVKAVRDAITNTGEAPQSRKELPKNLTPKQKVILAARARRRRLEKQAAAAATTAAATAVAAKTLTKEVAAPETQDDAKQGFFAKLFRRNKEADTSDQRDADPVVSDPSAPTADVTPSAVAPDWEDTFSTKDDPVQTKDANAHAAPPVIDPLQAAAKKVDVEADADPSAVRSIVKSKDKQARLAGLRERYGDRSEDKKSLMPLIIIAGTALLIAVGAWYLWQMIAKGGVSEVRDQPVIESTAPTDPATPVQATEDARALYERGVALVSNPTATREEQINAFQLIRRAAVGGNVPAQYQIGEMYRLGVGAQASEASAARWYQDAAESGNILAMHKLGVFYLTGTGVAQDAQLGLNYFEKAASAGLADSMFNLGYLYDPASPNTAENPGLPIDIRSAEKSFFWYKVTERAGDSEAGIAAAEIGAKLSLAKRTEIAGDAESFAVTPLNAEANRMVRVADPAP